LHRLEGLRQRERVECAQLLANLALGEAKVVDLELAHQGAAHGEVGVVDLTLDEDHERKG